MRNYDNNIYAIAVISAKSCTRLSVAKEIHFGRQLIESEDGSVNIPQSNIY
jgi:hypothetical protein